MTSCADGGVAPVVRSIKLVVSMEPQSTEAGKTGALVALGPLVPGFFVVVGTGVGLVC